MNNFILINKKLFIFIWMVCSLNTVFGQSPDTVWTKTYSQLNICSTGNSIQKTTDGGYIITGNSYNGLYLLKTDATGELIWFKIYGEDSDDKGNSVVQAKDGGYVIAGIKDDAYIWIIKTDYIGNVEWTKVYGGSGFRLDYANSLDKTYDGGYIIAGSKIAPNTNHWDVYLMKTNSVGDSLWSKCYGGSDIEYGYFVQQTVDSGFVITGSTKSFGAGKADLYIIKANIFGDTIWTKFYGGNEFDEGRCIKQTLDRGYILTGRTFSYGNGYSDLWIIRIDEFGDTLWTNTFGGTESDLGMSVIQSVDSNFVVVGATLSYGQGSTDLWTIKVDSFGKKIWDKTFGGYDSDSGNFILESKEDDYIIAGGTLFLGYQGLWLLKISENATDIEDNINSYNVSSYSLDQNYPNPFNPHTTISYRLQCPGMVKLTIYDILGHKIKELVNSEQSVGEYTVSWNGVNVIGNKVSTGIYYYRLETEKYNSIKKMVFVK